MTPDASLQDWDPISYARDAGFVAQCGAPLIDLLAPRAGERILDLGCGDGVLTEKLLAYGAQVVAVDSSGAQVEAARARGLDAHVADGEALTFEHEFDAVFSNATLHWMRRPERVIAGVRRALREHGRFVAELGGEGNTHTIHRALIEALERRGIAGAERSPWYFPSLATYRSALEHGGFVVERIETFARPTALPGDLLAWLSLFTQSFTEVLPAAERRPYLEEVQAVVAPKLRDCHGHWSVDYVRLRFVARAISPTDA